MESEEVSGGNAAVVNFYTELGLDRTWAVDQLQAKLQNLSFIGGVVRVLPASMAMRLVSV